MSGSTTRPANRHEHSPHSPPNPRGISHLADGGRARLGGRASAHVQTGLRGATPESYLGAARAERVANGQLEPGGTDFRLPPELPASLPPHHLAYAGAWRIRSSYATADRNGARVHLRFLARRVFLVLGTRGAARRVEVAVDCRPQRTVVVRDHRLYELVRLTQPGDHLLTLRFERGVEAYAFTFG